MNFDDTICLLKDAYKFSQQDDWKKASAAARMARSKIVNSSNLPSDTRLALDTIYNIATSSRKDIVALRQALKQFLGS